MTYNNSQKKCQVTVDINSPQLPSPSPHKQPKLLISYGILWIRTDFVKCIFGPEGRLSELLLPRWKI